MVDKKQEEVVIRTMKDDLAADNAAPQGEPPAAPAPPKPPAAPGGKVKLPKTKKEAKTPEEEAAPKPQPKKEKKRRGSALKRILLALLVLALLGSGAGAWWYFFGFSGLPGGEVMLEEEGESNEAAPAAELVPVNHSLLLRYRADTTAEQNQIRQMWSGEPGGDTLSAIVSGNPAAVFADESIRDVMYVVLPNNPRPFAIIPQTRTTEQLVTQQSRVQVSPHEGWYILHTINSGEYVDALSSGSLASGSGFPPLEGSNIAQLTLDPGMLRGLQASATEFGDALPVSDAQTFSLQYDAADTALSFVNQGSSPAPAGGPAAAQLLSLIPGDAQPVFVGHNFHGIAGHFGIENPAGLDLLRQLDTPYAYYQRIGEDAVPDAGAIAAVPEELQGELEFDDPVIEQLALALVPLLTGGDPASNLAFVSDFYKEVPLRFVNLNQTATSSVDYTLADDFAFVASSKEGMHVLIDTLLGDIQSFEVTSPWQELLSLSGSVPAGGSLTAGQLDYQPLLELLPRGGRDEVPFILVVGPDASPRIQGALGLDPL